MRTSTKRWETKMRTENTKEDQSEMKDTLIEIKNNLQGNNSRMDESKSQINVLEHKEAKSKPIRIK